MYSYSYSQKEGDGQGAKRRGTAKMKYSGTPSISIQGQNATFIPLGGGVKTHGSTRNPFMGRWEGIGKGLCHSGRDMQLHLRNRGEALTPGPMNVVFLEGLQKLSCLA